jgi:MoaA/NifB/PqqE/SkfB family radical SAM enzyme
MCNIWRIPAEIQDLTAEDWLRLLRSDLFEDLREIDITGGEPFLVKDLDELFEGILALRRRPLKALKSVALTTNGFLTDRVLHFAETVLPRIQATGLDLVLVCAMDGIGDVHDRIRNYKGGWARANETILGLMDLRNTFSNLIVGLKTTVLPANVGQLDDILRYANSRGLFTILSPCIITSGRYLNSEHAEALAFGLQDKEKLIDFYASQKMHWSYHGEALKRYFKTGEMKKPCSCGYNYFFVRHNGELFLCPLVNRSVGNVKETSVEHLFLSEKADQLRRETGALPECQACTEPGLERYALPYEGFHYLSLFCRLGKKRFLQLHDDMGLDKYL